MNRHKHSILERTMSSMLALLLVMISVISPLNTFPTYATGSWIDVSYDQKNDADIDLTVISDNESFEAGEEISLRLYLRNNTEETLIDGGLSFDDKKEVFSESGFVLPDDTEMYISEKGSLAGITLAPGEVFEAEFIGTVNDDATLKRARTLSFFFGAKDSDGNTFTRRVHFDYTAGYITFLPVMFEDGAEAAAGERGTMTLRLSLDQSSEVFEENDSNVSEEDTDVVIASDSDADVASDSDADAASDSDANVASDSDADVASDSNTAIASDSNTYIDTNEDEDEDEDTEKVSISHVSFAIETSDMEFEDVRILEANQVQTLNGTFEVEATIAYTVGADTEVGTHYGTVDATVKIGNKKYELSQGFELEVTGFTAEEMKAVQNVIDLIAKLPTMDEFFAAMDQFFPEDGPEDAEGYEAYIREVTKLAVPAFEAYEALSEELKALIDPADVEKLLFINGLCDPMTLEGERNYIALQWAYGNNTPGTLKIYCEGLVNGKYVDLLANATPKNSSGLIEYLSSNLDNTENISCSDIASKLTSEFGSVLNDTGKYELSYQEASIQEFAADGYAESAIENINLVSFNDQGGSDWHYTLIGNGNWIGMSNSNGKREAELTVYFNVTERARLTPIDNPTTLDATVQMFNYNAGTDGRGGINTAGLGANGYKFHGLFGTQSQMVDPYVTDTGKYRDNVPIESVLVNGYPMVDTENGINGSLAYLFDDTTTSYKTAYPEMNDGGGLFQYIDGYYEYDSAKNAAYYNAGSNRFTLYEDILRPQDIDEHPDQKENFDELKNAHVLEGNFLPFNEPWIDTTKGHTYNDLGYEVTSYPLDHYSGSGDLDTRTDYWFGMTLEFEFLMPKEGKINGDPMIFEFFGDDDVWVYIDDQLVLDIGACHEARSGFINFATGNVVDPTTNTKNLKSIFDLNKNTFEDYTVHKLKFFYMERGACYSYCRIRFNLPTLQENSIVVGKEVTADNNVSVIGDPDFRFQVLSAEDNTPFIGANVDFNILDADGNKIGKGKTGANGIFTLKADQFAEFPGILENAGEYFVRELMTEDEYKQYGTVYIDGEETDSGTGTDESSNTNKYFDSSIKDISVSNETTIFVFNNEITTDNLGELIIKKNLESPDEDTASEEFKMYVTLNDSPLAAGTKYTVNETEKTVTESGIIVVKHGEEAVIPNILNGTTYTVEEQLAEGQDYTVSYKVDDGDVTYTGPVSGIITTGSTVSVLVNNHEGAWVELQGTKKIKNPDGAEHLYKFNLTEVTDTKDLTPKSNAVSKEVVIEDSADSNTFAYKLKYYAKDYPNDGTVTKYYLITEDYSEGENVIYDSTKYLVEVKITTTNGIVAAERTGLWKVNNAGGLTDTNQIEFTNILLTDLTVTKEIKGNMADLNKQFNFNVTVTFDGETYTDYKITTANGANLNLDNEYEFALSNNQSVTIEKLPIGAKVTVTEDEEGYTAHYQVGSADKQEGNSATEVAVKVDNSDDILFTNEKNAIPDTGITMDTLPYILILLAVIGGIVFTVIRKRKDDDLD